MGEKKSIEGYRAVHTKDSKRFHKFDFVNTDKKVVGSVYVPKGSTMKEFMVNLIAEGDKDFNSLKQVALEERYSNV
jgi:hypothetical protein